MAVEVKAGWLYGTLPDDTGKEWPVVRNPQPSTGAQHGSPVNLVLHTTETSSLITKLQYPSNFQCGDGVISQHIALGESGDAVWTYDRDCIGIEMVARSDLNVWLPAEPTLGPTVALVAWLHSTGRIKTGVARPYDYPVKLDRLPAAVQNYYRRTNPTQKAGVYGHVDLDGGNEHWDPGSFDYPTFFSRVQATLDRSDMTDAEKAALDAATKFLKALGEQLGTAGPLASAKVLAAHIAAATPDTEVPHTHTVKVLGKTFTTSEA